MHKALLLLKKIPKGKVATYGTLARLCKTSPRAIGRIMSSNPYPIVYPCYKVVSSSGKLCGYSGEGGLETKTKMLRKDGIKVVDGCVDKKYFHKFTK
ncbi:MAG: MGMT family protein [Candidatus Aenigmarchaeota archaeon]|nr:MGMT family protein [Candidatus Aenigmarchaeota archaeon]